MSGPLRSEVHLAPQGVYKKPSSGGSPLPSPSPTPAPTPTDRPTQLTIPGMLRTYACYEDVKVGDFVRLALDHETLERADASSVRIVIGIALMKPSPLSAQVLLSGYVQGLPAIEAGARYFLGATGNVEPLPLKDEMTYRHPIGHGLPGGVFLFNPESPIHKRIA